MLFSKLEEKETKSIIFMISGSSKARLSYMCPVDGLRQPRPPCRGNCPGRRPQAPACFKFPFGMAYFQGQTVSFREGMFIQVTLVAFLF